jgi:hypothetical protein
MVGRRDVDGKSQIILTAVIFCGAISCVDFAASASGSSGKGRVIEFGWDMPSIGWLCDNVAWDLWCMRAVTGHKTARCC